MVLWFYGLCLIGGALGDSSEAPGGSWYSLYNIYIITNFYIYKTINHILSQLSLNINDLQNMVVSRVL